MHRLSNSELLALIDEHISGRNAQRNRAIMKRKHIDNVEEIKRYQQMYKNADI